MNKLANSLIIGKTKSFLTKMLLINVGSDIDSQK